MHRLQGIKVLLKNVENRPIVSNLGPTTDELWLVGHRSRNFYTYGSMGLCSSIALGMALSTDEQVISLDGDGSLLMNLGTLATIGKEKPANLIVVVWDNEEWGQTGHQPSHTATSTELAQVANACGISKTALVETESQLETSLREALESPGPWVIVAKVEETEPVPHAPIEPEITLYRFRATFPRAATNPMTQPWLNSRHITSPST